MPNDLLRFENVQMISIIEPFWIMVVAFFSYCFCYCDWIGIFRWLLDLKIKFWMVWIKLFEIVIQSKLMKNASVIQYRNEIWTQMISAPFGACALPKYFFLAIRNTLAQQKNEIPLNLIDVRIFLWVFITMHASKSDGGRFDKAKKTHTQAKNWKGFTFRCRLWHADYLLCLIRSTPKCLFINCMYCAKKKISPHFHIWIFLNNGIATVVLILLLFLPLQPIYYKILLVRNVTSINKKKLSIVKQEKNEPHTKK